MGLGGREVWYAAAPRRPEASAQAEEESMTGLAFVVGSVIGGMVTSWLDRREFARRLDRIEVRLVHLNPPWKS